MVKEAALIAGPWSMDNMITAATAPQWTGQIDAYTSWLRAAARRNSTIYIRTYHLRRLAAAHPDDGPWALTVDDLAAWLGGFRWEPDTRKSYRSSLAGFYAWAHATGRTVHDPAALLPKVHPPAGKPRPAPDAVFAQALDRAEPRTRLMLQFARFAGLRRAEISRVHRDDVMGREGAWSLRVVGKGGRVRDVPLLDELAQALLRCGGYLFPGREDGHLSPAHVGKLMSRALPGSWTAHPLRHAFASRAYEGERDIRAVQELLGHASVATTQIYTAVPDGALRAAVLAAATLAA